MASRFVSPFGTGRGLAGGDPLLDLHREMNRLFDDVFRGTGGPSGGGQQGSLISMPRIDVHEDNNELCIAAELPGVTQADLDLQLEGDVLTIAGEKKNPNPQKPQNYHVMERSYGRFQRVLQLPFAPDPERVHANFENGVLMIRVPKQAQQQRSRRIEVRGGESGPGQTGQAGGQQAGSAQSRAGAGTPGGQAAAGEGGSAQQGQASAGSV